MQRKKSNFLRLEGRQQVELDQPPRLLPRLPTLLPILPTTQPTEFFIDNLLVRIHFIIDIIWWTGLAPWGVEFPVPCSLISTHDTWSYEEDVTTSQPAKALAHAHALRAELCLQC